MSLDTQPSPPAVPVGRYIMLLGLTFLTMATGCVARHEALTANVALASATQAASQTTKDLAKVMDAEVNELKEIRDDYRRIVETYADARVQEARGRMEVLAQAALTALSKDFGKALVDIQTIRVSVNGKSDSELKLTLQPFLEKVTALRLAAEAAAERAKAFPNDVDRRRESVAADASYLAALARKIEIERDAIRTATASMDQAQAEVFTRLATALGDHEKKIADVLKHSTDTLAKRKDLPKIDFGSDPPSNTESFASLVKYTEAVSKASDAYENYIKSNSLGQGSYFIEFIKSAAQGIAGGVVHPSSVKALSPEGVKTSLNDLLSFSDSGLAENLNAVKEAFKAASGSISARVASDLLAKASDAIHKLVPNDSTK